jgi:tRNA(adenine34) deaminase
MMINPYMEQALIEAKKAASLGEVPVGAVIVNNGKIIARAHNHRETDNNALAHAEIIAIDEACKKLGRWRLEDSEIYVTLEPCPMCAGAIINSRLKAVYFGAYDSKAGACGSVVDLLREGLFNHTPDVYCGIMEDACQLILTEFFKNLRST